MTKGPGEATISTVTSTAATVERVDTISINRQGDSAKEATCFGWRTVKRTDQHAWGYPQYIACGGAIGAALGVPIGSAIGALVGLGYNSPATGAKMGAVVGFIVVSTFGGSCGGVCRASNAPDTEKLCSQRPGV